VSFSWSDFAEASLLSKSFLVASDSCGITIEVHISCAEEKTTMKEKNNVVQKHFMPSI
jgi:hypothetical protein